MKTYYYIPNICDRDELGVENAYEFKSHRDIESVDVWHKYDDLELSWLVEDMADDYVRNHDGWEICLSWQGEYREFAVWDTDKTFIGKFDVMMEYTPTFTAWRKK
jgi:GH43 family beta-xylosidase